MHLYSQSLPFNFKGVQVLGELKSVCALLLDLNEGVDLLLCGIKDQQDGCRPRISFLAGDYGQS